MGSAKTALLLTTAYNFEERQINYLCMKPVIDTREGRSVIHSRIGIERECRWIFADTNLYEEIRNLRDNDLEHMPDWILVDEAQFLSSAQVDQLAAIVDDFAVNVVCYGLRTDFRGNLAQGAQVEIGGNDRYVACCRKCWRNRKLARARRSQLPLFDDEQPDAPES